MKVTRRNVGKAVMASILQSLFVLTAVVPVYSAENWPQFRGPSARGVASNPDVPERWSASDNVRWKAEIPGRESL